MRFAILNPTKTALRFSAASLVAVLFACSERPSPELTRTDVARAQQRHLSGCAIKAELVAAGGPEIDVKKPRFSARFVRGPAPFLRNDPEQTAQIEIIDRNGRVLWSMGYDRRSAPLFRLPCVTGAHSVRLLNEGSSSNSDEMPTAIIAAADQL